jgi:hypothetical protein
MARILPYIDGLQRANRMDDSTLHTKRYKFWRLQLLIREKCGRASLFVNSGMSSEKLSVFARERLSIVCDNVTMARRPRVSERANLRMLVHLGLDGLCLQSYIS